MKVIINPNPEKSQTELKIEVPNQDLQPYVSRAAEGLTKEKALPGFRPGKAPLDVVVQNFGADRVVGVAIDAAIPRFFVRAVLDHDVDAINQPAVTIQKSGLQDDLVFTAIVDVLPEVKLGDPKQLEVKKADTTITDEDIEKELNYVAKMRSDFIDVTRAAEDGDTVVVHFKISVDGKVIDGGESQDHPVHIGEGGFIEDFEKGLIGISGGEERTYPVKFPDNYRVQEFAGKEAEAWVKADKVQKRVVPKIDDDFARSLNPSSPPDKPARRDGGGAGGFRDLNDLKTKMKENMQHEKAHKEEERYRGELVDKLTELSAFSALPEALVNQEIERRLQELAQMLTVQQKTIEQYLTEKQQTPDQLRAELQEPAEKAVKTGLTLNALAKQEDIDVTDKEVEEKATEYLNQFATTKDARDQIDPDQLRQSIGSTLKNQKTLARLEELATTPSA